MNIVHVLRLVWGIGLALFLSAAFNAVLLFRFVWIKRTNTRRRAVKLGLSLFTIVAMLFILEFAFAYVVVQSDGFGQTLASRLWIARYWQPINSRGYRDFENKHLDGRSAVFVVGDSFTAGEGIERIEDRFANTLAGMLGDGWEHVVIAKNGWNTGQEYKAVSEYPARPDAIVLSYYINDIQGAAERVGFPVPQNVRSPGRLTGMIVENSFFLNWLYWRTCRTSLGDEYWNYLRSSYSNPDIWNAHAPELQSFIDYASLKGAALCVVIWPSLDHISESREFTTKVVEFYRTRGISVIDLADSFKDRPSSDLCVNALDRHPNVQTHREVAALIYQELSRIGASHK